MPTYGEYELQVSKYQPLAYWAVLTSDQAAIEPSVYGTDAEIEKFAGTDGYKPIIYSADPGTNILFENDYLLIPSIEFNKIHIAKSSYNTQPFTINFWYKNENGIIDPDTEILKIGDAGDYRISLYTKNGKLLLNFLGQTSYYEIKDYRDLLNISIIFDGTNSKLMVNGEYGNTISTITQEFDSNIFVLFSAGTGCVCKFSHISIYGYEMSQAQVLKLYAIGTKKTNGLNQKYALIDGYLMDYKISDIYNTINFSLNNTVETRNCYLQNNSIYLKAKNMASVNGAVFSTNKYIFSGSQSISFNLLENDVDRNNASFRINSSDLDTASGTVLYIDCSQPISVITNSGTLEVYTAASSSPIFSNSVTTETYVAVELIDGEIFINLGGTKINTAVVAPLLYKSVVIGNNGVGTDAFSGSVTGFILNYANQPLQIGIYNLDLTHSYGSYIKPKQDGVAVFNVIATTDTTVNYVSYKSSGGTSLQKFNSSNTIEEYFACQNGNVLNDGDALFTPPLTNDELVLLSARVYDISTGNSYTDIDFPKISDLSIYGKSNYILKSNNSNIEVSSSSIYPYVPSTPYKNGMFAKTNSNIVFNGGTTQAKSVFFYIKPYSIPATNTIFEFAGTTLTLIKINNNTYKLSVDNGSTLYVNGTQYASGVQSTECYIYDDTFVGIVMPSAQNIDAYFANCSNILLSDIAFSNKSDEYFIYALTTLHKASFNSDMINIDDADILNLTDTINVKAFTSNIVFSG